MIERYSEHRSMPMRAQQIWTILIGQAHNRQTITYGQLAKLLGFGGSGVLGGFLAPVMWLCQDEGLPPLTCLVVNQDTGLPGGGLQVSAETLHVEREHVYHFDWYDLAVPDPDVFEHASQKHRHDTATGDVV